MLTLPNGDRTSLANAYQGRSAFLLGGGPSLTSHDLTQLQQRGILTLAVNNAAAVVRPHLWTCVDNPGNFCDAIWRDPAILKFVPQEHFDKPLIVRDSLGQLVPCADRVREMPAVFGYARNDDFVPERFLHEHTFNWGNHGKRTDVDGQRGSRSVMYVALKLLYYLGVRRIYLLGCDFRMEQGRNNYAFEQSRTASSVKGNNRSYEILDVRLGRLRPIFEQGGFQVFNCTPNSGLTVFPHVPFPEAVQTALQGFPQQFTTAGMYDRLQRERDAAKATREPQLPGGWSSAVSSACSSDQHADLPAASAPPAVAAIEGAAVIPERSDRPPVFGCFDHAYVLNLASRPDRLSHVTAECERVGIPFERFEAIRPAERGHFQSVGAHGCFLSHTAIWRAALEAKYRHILVLEDDVIFRRDCRQLFPRIAEELNRIEWDLFYAAARRKSRRGVLRIAKRVYNTHFYAATTAAMSYLLDHSQIPYSTGKPVDLYMASTPLRRLVPPENIAEQISDWSDVSDYMATRRKVSVQDERYYPNASEVDSIRGRS